MTHREVEILAVGAGPSNLALAVSIEELAPDDLAGNTLLIEKQASVSWQRGLLLPDALSQVSFVKDLVTLRDPRSRFSFLNYLHEVGRLDDFVNMGSFVPYRTELADYFQWAANSLRRVALEYERACERIEPRTDADGTVTGWVAHLGDGSTIGCRWLAVGAGRDPLIPEVFGALPSRYVVHSSHYMQTVAELARDRPYEVAVVGASQSSAEMFTAVQRDLPGSRPTMIMRSIGLNLYETSRFTNELYYASAVDTFYHARPEARVQMLAEMHRTNYAGIAAHTHEALYRQLYVDRLSGEQRLEMLTMTDVTAAHEDGGGVVLSLTDRRTGETRQRRFDLVLLGTGFAPGMPRLVRRLAASVGLDEVEVTRNYRLILGRPATAACFLQGVNEATHGIADSLLSVLAIRAQDIVTDIFAQREQPALPGGEQLSTTSIAANQ